MKNLLIVDDQKGIQILLEEIFRKEGYRTRLASNGLIALQEIEAEVPDCMLLDMNMPGMNGMEVLKNLKEDWPSIPIIMMTADGASELMEKASDFGVRKYFTKPFDVYELREAVNEILGS